MHPSSDCETPFSSFIYIPALHSDDRLRVCLFERTNERKRADIYIYIYISRKRRKPGVQVKNTRPAYGGIMIPYMTEPIYQDPPKQLFLLGVVSRKRLLNRLPGLADVSRSRYRAAQQPELMVQLANTMYIYRASTRGHKDRKVDLPYGAGRESTSWHIILRRSPSI